MPNQVEDLSPEDRGLLFALLARKEELERERARIEREMREIGERVGELVNNESCGEPWKFLKGY
ncbi:MAG: hypothetical protein FD177_247 [Desulfovibrionaceae bacterium]|nr:MAG: hypothetical protein FD177_247 [Desulfovibrionaceae bacterium]